MLILHGGLLNLRYTHANTQQQANISIAFLIAAWQQQSCACILLSAAANHQDVEIMSFRAQCVNAALVHVLTEINAAFLLHLDGRICWHTMSGSVKMKSRH